MTRARTHTHAHTEISLGFTSVKHDVLELSNVKTFCLLIFAIRYNIHLKYEYVILSRYILLASSITVMNVQYFEFKWDSSFYFRYLIITYICASVLSKLSRISSYFTSLSIYLSVYLCISIPLYPNYYFVIVSPSFLNFFVVCTEI